MKKIISYLLISAMILCSTNITFAKEKAEDDIEIEEITDEEWEEIQANVDAQIQEAKSRKINGETELKYLFPDDEDEPEILTAIYEEEPNNTLKTADRIYVNDSVWGTIEDEDDIDCYKIKFDAPGYARFRLSLIPEDCDYDLFLFSQGNDLIDESSTGGDSDENIYTFVTADIYYYIRVESFDNYDDTDEYKLRVTLDEDVEEFSFSVGTDFCEEGKLNEIDTSEKAELAAETFTDMGYISVLSTIPTLSILEEENPDGSDRLGSSIVHLDGHGSPTHIRFTYKNKGNSGNIKYNTGVSKKKSDEGLFGPDHPIFVPITDIDVKDTRLMIFCACETANSDVESTPIAKYAYIRGVETSLGWAEDIPVTVSGEWNERFYKKLKLGYSVGDAADYADEYFNISSPICSWRLYGNYDNVVDRNYGTYSINALEDLNEAKNILNNTEELYIDVNNEDFAALEDYITEYDNSFNADDYQKIVREAGDNIYKVGYSLFNDGFETGYGFTALIKDDKVINIKELNPDAKICLLADVNVTDNDIETAKQLASEEIDEDEYAIVKQEVQKVIEDSKHKINVYTTYADDYGTDYESYGCKLYQYVLD